MSEGRHASRPSRKPALIVGGIVAVLVIGVVVVVLASDGSGRGGGLIPGIGDDGPVTPEFSFETTKVLAVPTRVNVTPEELKPAAQPSADEIEGLMDALYLEAFFDVDNWTAGSYDEVWPLFDTDAAAEAQAQAAVLTAGEGAGDAFDQIEPGLAQLKTKVLLSHKDEPVAVVAVVIFRATGRGKDGAPDVLMQSNGEFTFRQIDGEWKIVAFHVQRDDEEQTAAPSPTPSAEAS
ncbi:MAG: hypothetical protein U0V56_06265 [Actinomycetota bacterium]